MMTEENKPLSNETEEKTERKFGGFSRALPIVLFALGVFFALCFITEKTGPVGAFLSFVFLGLFSYAAYLIPLLFIIDAVFFKSDLQKGRVLSRVFFSLVSLFSGSLLISTFTYRKIDLDFELGVFFNNGVARTGGGVFGNVLYFLLKKAFGYVGVVVILLAVLALYYTFFFAREKDLLHLLFSRICDFFSSFSIKMKQFFKNLFKSKKKKRVKVKLSAKEAKAAEKYEALKRDGYLSSSGVTEVRIRELGIHDVYDKKNDAPFVGDVVEAEPIRRTNGFDAPAPALSDRAEDVFTADFDPFRVPLNAEKRTPEKESFGIGSYEQSLDVQEAAYDRMLREKEFERKKKMAMDRFAAIKEREEAEARARSFSEVESETIREARPAEDAYLSAAYEKPTAEDADDGDFSPITSNASPRAFGGESDTLYTERSMLNPTPPAAFPADEEEKDAHRIPTEVYEPPVSDDAKEAVPDYPQKTETVIFDAEEKENDAYPDEPIAVEGNVLRDENDYSDYRCPPSGFLHEPDVQYDSAAQEAIARGAEIIIGKLAEFGVQTSLSATTNGPRVTRYEIEPAQGVRVSQITKLFPDIELALASEGVRMEAPIPGKSAIGFEVPKRKPRTVYLRELVESQEFQSFKSKTVACLGKDVSNKSIFCDIADMPHLLIAGATGMGKSVCINSILLSVLYRARPDEVKLIVFDPKFLDFSGYNGIPHLLVPVVTEAQKAAGVLSWAIDEMERRNALMAKAGRKKIDDFNDFVKGHPEFGGPIPKIIIVVDELADLMLQVKKSVEPLISRLAAKARAAGIHLILGTQRPSVDVVTGLIKANFPSRMSFKVAAPADSVVVLGEGGAEKLLNRGDMLYMPAGATRKLRLQSAFVSDEEAERVLSFLRSQSKGNVYNEEVMYQIDKAAQKCNPQKGKSEESYSADDFVEGDNTFDASLQKGSTESYLHDKAFLAVVNRAVEGERVSTSYLQRIFSLGFQRASRYMDVMEEMGVVSEQDGSKPRRVLMSKDEWIEYLSHH